MARLIVILAIAGALFAGAFGAAAHVDVQGASVQAGSDSTLACAKSPLTVTAWATNTYAGAYEGLDWVTITMTAQDSERCAGNDLTGRLTLTGDTFAYGGKYYNGFGPLPAKPGVIPVVSGTTEYTMGFYNQAFDAKVWVDPEKISAIKLWLGGPAQVNN